MGYRRAMQRKRKLLKLYSNTKTHYLQGAWYDYRKDRIVKYCASNTPGYTKMLRRISNRKVRRAKDMQLKGCSYKKHYDYWWELD